MNLIIEIKFNNLGSFFNNNYYFFNTNFLIKIIPDVNIPKVDIPNII